MRGLFAQGPPNDPLGDRRGFFAKGPPKDPIVEVSSHRDHHMIYYESFLLKWTTEGPIQNVPLHAQCPRGKVMNRY